MKMNKMQILLAVVLLGNAVAMQGMLTQGRKIVRNPIVYKPIEQKTYKPVYEPAQPMPAPRPTTQTWGNWFRSLFVVKPIKPVQSYAVEEVAPSPFATGGQKRMYSTRTSSTPKASSWGNWFKSFFESTNKEETAILTNEEIDRLLEGHVEAKDQYHPLPYGYMLFDENDLEKAKQKLGTMIEQDAKYKDSIIDTWKYYYSFGNRPHSYEQTLLDKVFLRLFNGEENRFGIVTFTPSESALYYIKLIEYLISKGARIDPRNKDIYQQAYSDKVHSLMKSYKGLYKPNPLTVYGVEYEIQKFKEIFKALDPIMEQIMPEFQPELAQTQKERMEIELNEGSYRKKAEEESNKAEYMHAKRDYLFNEYQKRTGDYESYPNEVKIDVEFNEKEYQNWLKSGKSKNFFYPEWEQAFKSGFKFGREFSQDQLTVTKNTITQLLGIAATSSEKEISNAYRKFAMQYHPDVTQDPNNPMSLKLKNEINPAWDEYNKALTAAKQEQEKMNRE
jgi:DnaJ domain